MPGLVPGTHAGPRCRGVSDPVGAVRDPVRLGTAWLAGTSPAMTGRRAGTAWDPSCPPSADLPAPSPLSCPGSSRAPTPVRAATGLRTRSGPSGTGAAPRGVGGRDKPGHDGMEGGDSLGSIMPALNGSPPPSPPSCPGSSRAPTPVRAATGLRTRSGPSGTGAAWVAGTSPAMTGRRAGTAWDPSGPPSADLPAPSPPSCPGSSRAPTPARATAGARAGPGPSGARCGSARRGWPGQARP